MLVKNRLIGRGLTALPYATPTLTTIHHTSNCAKVHNNAADLLAKSSPLPRTQPHYPTPVIHIISNYNYLLCCDNLYVPFNTALGQTH